METKDELLERFWSKVNILSEDECWEWKAGINSTGRGIFKINGKSIHAHRMAWILTNGEIPNGMFICHHCDNGKCMNPKHLFVGTPADNVHDMINKGRKITLHGEDDPKSKLTEKQVIEIKQLYIPYKFTQYKLAEMYNVSRSAIESIICGYNWQHLDNEGAKQWTI